MTCFVGIDIAAKTFDLVSRTEGKNAKVMTFKQTKSGFSSAIEKLNKLKPQRIVMEATGIYFFDLALALTNAGFWVSVINPKSFHHFAKMKLTGSKTDPIDSALLAEYAERMDPPRWTPPAPLAIVLRDIGRQINRLVHSRTQAKNRLHALTAKECTADFLIEDEELGIEQLEQRLERLKGKAEEVIESDEALKTSFANLKNAKGIGDKSAIAILAELCVMPSSLNSAQISRFAGLDVRLTQSGSSIARPGRLSKVGNAYLRSALYMPAMVAVRYDERAQAFYQSLQARGKKPIQAQCAVMRKLLTGIWACIRTGTAFDSEQLFSEIHFKNA